MSKTAVFAALWLAGASWAAEEPSFYPRILVPATGLPATPGGFASARDCAYCHPLQHQQWQGSMHANAFIDPFYQAVWREASRETGGAADRFCAGCHTPVGSLTQQVWIRESGEIVIDPRAAEGVTCDFCHTVVGVKVLEKHGNPGNSGFAVEPDGPKRGPHADVSSSFHATEYSDLHTRSEFCGACHNVFHPVTQTAIARTYDEWKGSVYAANEIHCQDCHMVPPEVAARVAITLEKAVRRGVTSVFDTERSPFFDHDFTGANAAIPTLLSHWRHANDARLRLQSAARLAVVLPAEARPGTTLPLEVRVENAGAGHNLPTSMTELRELWLQVSVRDEGQGDALLWESGALDARGRLDPAATRYGAQAVDALGAPTWKPWKIERIVKDTSIPPKSTAVETYQVPLPADARGPIRVTARLLYRSLPQDVADAYLNQPGWQVPVVEMTSVEARVNPAP